MGKYKKLVQNTAIFAIGSFGTRVLSFLIVPLYTYVLTTAEYGEIDLFTTAISMFLPFSCLMFSEAVLRFGAANECMPEKIVANSMLVVGYSVVFTLVFIPIYIFGFGFGENTWIYITVLILNGYGNIFSEYLRACNKTAAYAISGVIQACGMMGCNLFFLIKLHLGMRGYLYAMLVSQLMVALYVTYKGRIVQLFSYKNIDIALLKKMLRYSVPLIPNSLMWWIMSAGDKYIINYFLGDSVNGIYSIALKVPTIVSMAYSIFMQAWQLSAIEEKNSEEVSDFYDEVFSAVSLVVGAMSAGIMLVVYPVFTFVLNEEYHTAWEYVPLLCIATILSCFGSFFGVTYIVTKKSDKAFITTMIGAVANIGFNFMLVRQWGLYGVVWGTIVGYFIVVIIRYQDMKNDMNILVNIKRFYVLLGILLIEATMITTRNNTASYLLSCGIVLFVFFLYRSEVLQVAKILNKKFLKKR